MTNKQIIQKLKKAKKIAILAHRDPDPDACGSMFGLREFCRAIGNENVDVFAKKTKKKNLHYIFPLDEARDDFKADAYDLIVFVDIHEIRRTERIFQEELLKLDPSNIMILDHHEVSDKSTFLFKNCRIVKGSASASQLVADLYRTAELTPSVEAATYIYAGLMGDTDRFLHSNLSEQVFEDALFLLKNGANTQHVYDYLYRFKTREVIEFNKYFLNHLKFIEDGKVGFLVVSEKDIKKLGIDREDVKMFSNEITKIRGVLASFLCIEFTDGRYKVSLRSVGDLSTRDFAVKMNGGGHINASGFEIAKTTKRKLKKMIPIWAKELLNGR